MPDERHALPWPDRERHAAQHPAVRALRGRWLTPRRRTAMLTRLPAAPAAARGLGRGVGKPDALELNLSTHPREGHGIGRILHGHRLVQHTKDTLGAGHRRLEDVVLLGEVLDRPEESLGILDEGDEHAECDRLLHHPPSAVPDQQRRRYRAEESDERIEQGKRANGLQVGREVVAV